MTVNLVSRDLSGDREVVINPKCVSAVYQATPGVDGSWIVMMSGSQVTFSIDRVQANHLKQMMSQE